MLQIPRTRLFGHIRNISFLRKKPKASRAKRPGKQDLIGSKEAQKQLSAGAALMDGAEAVPVPILETLFDDANIYTRPNDTLKTPTPYVSPKSSYAQSPSELKGVQTTVLSTLFAKRWLKKGPPYFVDKTHAIYYYPPWHHVALARRSRPGVVLCFTQGKEFNGKQAPECKSKGEKSRNPFNYAVWRGRTKRIFKRAFWNAWTKTAKPCDGLYLILMDQVPEDEAQLERSLKKYLGSLTMQGNFSWVDHQASQVKLADVNRQLLARHYSPLKEWPRETWESSKEDI
ncbi:hypothetical protein B9G98_01731 [Wickerhamiella sorbophila]|uniref:Uncharacterized protein n=1 Tax=Wickerhamiella sorbophila TaxID=45607 RepID=A0A2T0FGJ5_9ASCO|nr:hypothetical protein B9G98_01731 [Wickerhamiella sorbophila]PRT54111.1 hypothetical protein B9G98_01731 [Wickerhamiella sorbophila]